MSFTSPPGDILLPALAIKQAESHPSVPDNATPATTARSTQTWALSSPSTSRTCLRSCKTERAALVSLRTQTWSTETPRRTILSWFHTSSPCARRISLHLWRSRRRRKKPRTRFFLSAFTSVLTFESSHRAYSKSSCVVDAVMRRAGGGVLLSLFLTNFFSSTLLVKFINTTNQHASLSLSLSPLSLSLSYYCVLSSDPR